MSFDFGVPAPAHPKPAAKKPKKVATAGKNKGGRPPAAGVARSTSLLVKLTPEEKALINKASGRYNMTMSELSRRAMAEVVANGFRPAA